MGKKWPLFNFYIEVWRFSFHLILFSPNQTRFTYEYIYFAFDYQGKELCHFHLYDTYERIDGRFEREKKIIKG